MVFNKEATIRISNNSNCCHISTFNFFEFKNFKFHLVLSDAQESDNWVAKKDLNDTEGDGFVGFVHQVVIDQYLTKHETPEDIELYFCGPPLMNQAVLKMADDWGIPDENVRFDDFGG